MTADAASVEQAHPRRRRLAGPARGQQLLDVAEELFTEHGYEGVSIEDIARAAEVTRPIVYLHHGPKDGIFLACVRRARDDYQHTVIDRTSQAEGLEGMIEAGGAAYFELIASNPRRWALLFATSASLSGDLADHLSELRFGTIAAIADQARTYVSALPGINVSEQDLFAFAFANSGVGEQLGRFWLRNPHIPREQIVQYYTTIVSGMASSMLEAGRV